MTAESHAGLRKRIDFVAGVHTVPEPESMEAERVAGGCDNVKEIMVLNESN
jgi:hypothetical protein